MKKLQKDVAILFLKKLFIYLAVLGLSCGLQASLIVVRGLSCPMACGILIA